VQPSEGRRIGDIGADVGHEHVQLSLGSDLAHQAHAGRLRAS
jgi:hypothetical protein